MEIQAVVRPGCGARPAGCPAESTNPPGQTEVMRPAGERVGRGETVGAAARDGAVSSAASSQARARMTGRPPIEQRRLEELDGAAGPDGLHPDLALVEGETPEDVEADAAQHQAGVRVAGAVAVDGVDDQAAERAEVLLVRIPGAADVGGGLVAVLVDPLEVAVQRVSPGKD